jgi:hypothetical protein
MKNNQIIILDDINANSLPELQGWKEKQESLVKENPFISVTDNKTFEEAKKRRTALLKGRTEIEKQDKLVASKLKEFRGKVSEASKELILITTPHEEKQQTEVKRYEELKAKEKAEKERIEAERKQAIKDSITSIFQEWKTAISNLTFEGLEEFLMIDILADADTSKFEEFELDFAEKVQILTNLFNEKKQQLEISEKQRVESENLKKEREELERKQKLEDERLKKERKQFEKEQKLAKEKAEKEAENKRKEQEKIDAENKRKADEIAKKEAELQVEKDRLAKIESDRLAKEKADKKAKEDAERKVQEEKEIKERKQAVKERLEALQPDKEKLQKVIDSICINAKRPELQDTNAIEFYNKLESEIEAMKISFSNSLIELK